MSRSVGRPNKDSMVKFSYWQVTEKQHELLTVLAETGSVDMAVKAVGSTKYKLGLMLATPEGKEPSAFVKAYDHVMNGLAKDFDYSKVKNLSTLKGLIEDMQNSMVTSEFIEEKVKAANVMIKAIQEVNKMQEGNLAIKKSEHNEKKVELKAVIDLSKPAEEEEMERLEAQEVDYVDISEEDSQL